jgi:hypothetical protein
MAKLSGKEIRELAKKIVRETPGGIRYSALVRQISQTHPETPINTIHGNVWDLDKTFSGQVLKPSRGLFVYAGQYQSEEREAAVTAAPIREGDFYEPFAEWLKTDLDEATEAVALGGAGMRSKWGTPDVVGVFKPLPSNRIKFDLEIVSAEVKTNPNESIVAFGQAMAYRLFSHKVYLVLPSTVPEEDQSRIEALALLFGAGFVLFDPNTEEPHFRVRVRAQRFTPDMFYVNDFADRLHDFDRALFNRLFQ